MSPERYHGENNRFIYSTLAEYSPDDLINFFGENGILTIRKEDGRCYPRTLESRTFTNFFEAEIKRKNINLYLEEKVLDIKYHDSFEVVTDKRTFLPDILIIASGGKTYKNLGSDGSMFAIIDKLGHRLTKFSPAICRISLFGDFSKKLRELDFSLIYLWKW